jgi:hypothetical protein
MADAPQEKSCKSQSQQKSIAEFAARYGGEQFGSFFAAACMWQKILCAERVFFRPFMGGKARVGAIPVLSKKA